MKSNNYHPYPPTLINPHLQSTNIPTSNIIKQIHHSNLQSQKSKNNSNKNNTTYYTTPPQATHKNNTNIPPTPTSKKQYYAHHNNTASTYRPRQQLNNNYEHIQNWYLSKTTKHTNETTTHPHYLPIQIENTTHARPNLFTTTRFTLTKYYKINKRKPKSITQHGYYFINKLELLQCGDIEPNPGPMPNILQTHPPTHRQIAKTYFIPNTIKLHPEYQHIAKDFAPVLKIEHPRHQQAITELPYLHQYIQTQNQSPPSHILYALVITIHPSVNRSNDILAQPHIYYFNNIWTNTLIIRLANLYNPPERHILTTHPYTKFIETNQNLIFPKKSIHNELYESIHNQNTPHTPITLQKEFPFLPTKLIAESLRCLENLNEYSHPPSTPNTPTPLPRTNLDMNHETNIITWNASSLNTTLPNLQNLINNTPTNTAIINIQETKLTATKSTKYIQNLFPEYKLIFNNTHTFTRCIQQRMPYKPSRGGLLTLIHNKYAFPGNVNKIPTPANISPYLQIIKINNHPLLPWLIIHIYICLHIWKIPTSFLISKIQ